MVRALTPPSEWGSYNSCEVFLVASFPAGRQWPTGYPDGSVRNLAGELCFCTFVAHSKCVLIVLFTHTRIRVVFPRPPPWLRWRSAPGFIVFEVSLWGRNTRFCPPFCATCVSSFVYWPPMRGRCTHCDAAQHVDVSKFANSSPPYPPSATGSQFAC